MGQFSIACLQLGLENADNRALLQREILSVKSRFPWIDMVLIGELAAFGTATRHAEPMTGDTLDAFRKIAAKTGLWLIPGSFYEQDGERIYNTAPVIDPSGQLVARHRKLYPFLPYEQGVTAGDGVTIFDVPGIGRFGLSICYDMWFPETSRALVLKGAEVILHPGLTNTIDRDAELAIARAAAATNQCYFLDLNVAGNLGVGRSGFFGPGGEVLHLAGSGREIIPLTLDFDRLRRNREQGWNGLGQVLKSFRDGPVSISRLGGDRLDNEALTSLGPLAMATRTNEAG